MSTASGDPVRLSFTHELARAKHPDDLAGFGFETVIKPLWLDSRLTHPDVDHPFTTRAAPAFGLGIRGVCANVRDGLVLQVGDAEVGDPHQCERLGVQAVEPPVERLEIDLAVDDMGAAVRPACVSPSARSVGHANVATMVPCAESILWRSPPFGRLRSLEVRSRSPHRRIRPRSRVIKEDRIRRVEVWSVFNFATLPALIPELETKPDRSVSPWESPPVARSLTHAFDPRWRQELDNRGVFPGQLAARSHPRAAGNVGARSMGPAAHQYPTKVWLARRVMTLMHELPPPLAASPGDCKNVSSSVHTAVLREGLSAVLGVDPAFSFVAWLGLIGH